MHDLYPSTANAVKKLVPRLKRGDISSVTIDELYYSEQESRKSLCEWKKIVIKKICQYAVCYGIIQFSVAYCTVNYGNHVLSIK